VTRTVTVVDLLDLVEASGADGNARE
jgi:hypothetical protein